MVKTSAQISTSAEHSPTAGIRSRAGEEIYWAIWLPGLPLLLIFIRMHFDAFAKSVFLQP